MEAAQKGITRHERGAYRVDERTEGSVPPEPPWTGRVQQTRPDGAMQLITHTGYEWWADPQHLREATQREREAYDRDRERHLAAVRPVRPSS
ncbi:hypothetical protein FM076_14670 [Streptomyces albus subsp. chlorinus]|uniref:hypothetical protein n=1 Tax=Streptomyces albus TaxID=1888 RepID=UPI00156EECDC|nr:hypothetical protein [Streptomyces albus]NSC22362.1 hypothetical protein [Streptomyces albus subsp. chlorinus]